jgi:DNA-binding PadR family transcriptional regulator
MNLGWFELQLLILISQQESYGYEILQTLKHSGNLKISTGALYPALRRLEEKGYVKTRHYRKKKPPDRVYYCISDTGKLILMEMANYLLMIIDRCTWKYLTEFRELIIQKANIKEGDTIMDFSITTGELFALDLSQKVGKSGRVLLIIDNINQKRIYKKYFSKIKIENIKIISGQIPFTPLIDNSVDSAVQIIGLHHFKEPLNVIREMTRIIKPGGKLIISDIQKIDHIIFNYVCKMFLANHYRNGTSEQELYDLLSKSKLKNIKTNIWHGMVIGEGIKEDIIKSRKLL